MLSHHSCFWVWPGKSEDQLYIVWRDLLSCAWGDELTWIQDIYQRRLRADIYHVTMLGFVCTLLVHSSKNIRLLYLCVFSYWCDSEKRFGSRSVFQECSIPIAFPKWIPALPFNGTLCDICVGPPVSNNIYKL